MTHQKDRNTIIVGSSVHFLFVLIICERQATMRAVAPMVIARGRPSAAVAAGRGGLGAALPMVADMKHVYPPAADPPKRGRGRPPGQRNIHLPIERDPASSKVIIPHKRKRSKTHLYDAAKGKAARPKEEEEYGSAARTHAGASQGRPGGGGISSGEDTGDECDDDNGDESSDEEAKSEKKSNVGGGGGGGGGASSSGQQRAGVGRGVKPSGSSSGQPGDEGDDDSDDDKPDSETDDEVCDELIENPEVDEDEVDDEASPYQGRRAARASDSSSSSDDEADGNEEEESEEEEEKKEKKSSGGGAARARRGKQKPKQVMRHAHAPEEATGEQRRENKCNKCTTGATVAYTCNLIGKVSQCKYSECAACYAKEQPKRDADDKAKGRLPWVRERTPVAGFPRTMPPLGLNDIAPTATILDIFHLFVPITLLRGIVTATNSYALRRGKVIMKPNTLPAHPITPTHTHHHQTSNINFHIHNIIHIHHHSILTYIHTHHRNRICIQ